MVKYDPIKMTDFNQRIAMCEEVRYQEGAEIGDAIGSLLNSSEALNSAGYDDMSDMCLTYAEDICRDYINWIEDEERSDYLENFPNEVYKHFRDGMDKPIEEQNDEQIKTDALKKLTKKERKVLGL